MCKDGGGIMSYIFDLIRTSFRHRNIGMIVFFIINCLCIFTPFKLVIGIAVSPALSVAFFLVFFIAYVAIILVAGELIVRLMFGGNQIIMGTDTSSISIAFAEAYSVAKQQDPSLSDNIKLYACSVNYPDAYAFGRSTILISDSASNLSQTQLRTLFLEKFAQIANHDSERIQLLIAGNAIFVGLIFLVKIMVYMCVALLGIIMSVVRMILSIFARSVGHVAGGLFVMSAYLNVCRVLSNAIESVLLFFLNLLIRIALLSARNNYYINDAFVCSCGYKEDLRYYLQYVEPDIRGYNSTLGTISAAKAPRLSRLSRLDGYMQSNDLPMSTPDLNIFSSPEDERLTARGQATEIQTPGFRVLNRNNRNENSNESVNGFRVVSRDDN